MKNIAILLNTADIKDLVGFKTDFGVDKGNGIHDKVNPLNYNIA